MDVLVQICEDVSARNLLSYNVLYGKASKILQSEIDGIFLNYMLEMLQKNVSEDAKKQSQYLKIQNYCNKVVDGEDLTEEIQCLMSQKDNVNKICQTLWLHLNTKNAILKKISFLSRFKEVLMIVYSLFTSSSIWNVIQEQIVIYLAIWMLGVIMQNRGEILKGVTEVLKSLLNRIFDCFPDRLIQTILQLLLSGLGLLALNSFFSQQSGQLKNQIFNIFEMVYNLAPPAIIFQYLLPIWNAFYFEVKSPRDGRYFKFDTMMKNLANSTNINLHKLQYGKTTELSKSNRTRVYVGLILALAVDLSSAYLARIKVEQPNIPTFELQMNKDFIANCRKIMENSKNK